MKSPNTTPPDIKSPTGPSLVIFDMAGTTVQDQGQVPDAFTAALCHHYLQGAALETMNLAANRMGAWVASQAGATPPPDPAVLANIM